MSGLGRGIILGNIFNHVSIISQTSQKVKNFILMLLINMLGVHILGMIEQWRKIIRVLRGEHYISQGFLRSVIGEPSRTLR